ncbi:MAG: DUF4160 domain-containing protein [Desulfotomaculum sp.]|nr:DUF4160 domain-containing protein [Desulfotomaculum sp.]
MPVICEFLGFKVYIYFKDHQPPHIHLRGGGFEAMLSIADGQVLKGQLPNKLRVVAIAWVRQEKDALLENWQRAQTGTPLFKICPPK